MNHKRRRPKSSRAGCLLCKPHKLNRGKNAPRRARPSVFRHLQDDPWEQAAEYRSLPWYPFLCPDEP